MDGQQNIKIPGDVRLQGHQHHNLKCCILMVKAAFQFSLTLPSTVSVPSGLPYWCISHTLQRDICEAGCEERAWMEMDRDRH